MKGKKVRVTIELEPHVVEELARYQRVWYDSRVSAVRRLVKEGLGLDGRRVLPGWRTNHRAGIVAGSPDGARVLEFRSPDAS